MQLLKKIPAITALTVFLFGCEKMFIEPPAKDPEAIFKNLWTTFQEEYAPFSERNVDWQAEYNTYRPMVDANTTDAELFDIISQILGTLDDGHVTLTAPNRDIYFSNRIRREQI